MATVDYFRCGYCGHVWCVRKTDAEAKYVPVTRRADDSGEGDGGESQGA